MSERKKYIPSRVEAKLKNDYSVPIPEGSITLEELTEALVTHLSQSTDERSAKIVSTKIISQMRKISTLLSFTIFNPDSVKNKSLVHYISPDKIHEILLANEELSYAPWFTKREYFEALTAVLTAHQNKTV